MNTLCGCWNVAGTKEAMGEIWAELYELIHCKNWPDFLDEVSDIAFGVGRLLGGWKGLEYVHVPGDKRHIQKIKRRFHEYGCIRSKRHLINGRCPNSQ